MDSNAVLQWFHDRIVSSNLFEYGFELRDSNVCTADEITDITGHLTTHFMLGNCLKFADVLGQIVGREHIVSFVRPDGRLIHAMLAVTPQYETDNLRGSAIDILGRQPLKKAKDNIEESFGPVFIEIGTQPPSSWMTDTERQIIRDIASALPWSTAFAGPAKIDATKLLELVHLHKNLV